MGLHELAVNALKHGALSNDSGRVFIHWEVDDNELPLLRFKWMERGGPAVEPPARKGFGARLIERILAQDLGGVIHLHFDDPIGVSCVIETRLVHILAPAAVLPFPRIGTVRGSGT
jgi:two-component sensor histidine kinase